MPDMPDMPGICAAPSAHALANHGATGSPHRFDPSKPGQEVGCQDIPASAQGKDRLAASFSLIFMSVYQEIRVPCPFYSSNVQSPKMSFSIEWVPTTKNRMISSLRYRKLATNLPITLVYFWPLVCHHKNALLGAWHMPFTQAWLCRWPPGREEDIQDMLKNDGLSVWFHSKCGS